MVRGERAATGRRPGGHRLRRGRRRRARTPILPTESGTSTRATSPSPAARSVSPASVEETSEAPREGVDRTGHRCEPAGPDGRPLRPGGFIAKHDHAFEEGFFFLAGEIEAELDGETYTLRAGDYCWSGVGSMHALTNRTDLPVRWLETQAPQPPSRYQARFVADWPTGVNRPRPAAALHGEQAHVEAAATVPQMPPGEHELRRRRRCRGRSGTRRRSCEELAQQRRRRSCR